MCLAFCTDCLAHVEATRRATRGIRRKAPEASIQRMYEIWLFLHVLGAIAAFGFGFYAPIFGMAAAREPQHSNWYLRATKRVSNGVLVPVAISMFITGTLLVASTGGMRQFEQLWLMLSLLLYVIALLIVFLAQRPALSKVIALTSESPASAAATPAAAAMPAAAIALAAAAPGAPSAQGDPRAEVPVLIRRLQSYGYVLLALVIAIVALMVWKPGL